VVLIILAGPVGAPLVSGAVAPLFWVGVVALGLLVPLALNVLSSRQGQARSSLAVLVALLVLLGGALLRISLVVAGQV
jgi:protein NrfD